MERALYSMLKADMTNLASRQEIYYSEHYNYSADPGLLGFAPSQGVVVILDATKAGWSARATHPGLGEGKGCAFYYGEISPPTSPVAPAKIGQISCSDSPRAPTQAEPALEVIQVDSVATVPEPVGLGDLLDGPAYTPYTERPDITNRSEVFRALEREYPPLLRDAGIGGSARVWFLVDARGVVRKIQIDESSGHEALDDAAIRVAEVIRFTPARNREKLVPVWISLPITFRPG
jgi:TonB family protein